MPEKKDHVFFFEQKQGKWGMAFCESEGYDRDQARKEVVLILHRHLNAAALKSLNYLGMLDYREMDPGIQEQLHYFIKFDPVWVLLNR